jgi:hypothetical protein
METFIGRIREIESGDTRISAVADFLSSILEEQKNKKSEEQDTPVG